MQVGKRRVMHIRVSIRQDTVLPNGLSQDEAVTSTASRDMDCQKRWPAVEHQLKETLSRTHTHSSRNTCSSGRRSGKAA